MALDDYYCHQWGLFKQQPIDIQAGVNELVAAVPNKRIGVFLFLLSGDATVRFDLYSGENKIFSFYGMEYFGVPLITADKHVPIFITNVGEALRLVVGSTVNASVYLHYKEKEKCQLT